ncbi:group 1 truncated hemoglobin [Rhizobiales bacterium]|uniref:group I truncated hemoglobin n=1 Tax=Hongsoonwoonella zoysiae TaxID=2821844 RepID=UPI00156022F8|nr:group 1 truncated hemoglobin [Hongsoonwoonella zoysiae]NRG16917.1 group 1 truncated hemoglobin [Hongsoonwoonella zoysiae]
MALSLFERLGGFAPVSRIVLNFYYKVEESENLAKYFEDVEMGRLIDHQTKFMASLMGGPASYDDATLQRIHEPLRITEEAFEEMASVLQEALEDFDCTPEDVASVLQEFRRRRRMVVHP